MIDPSYTCLRNTVFTTNPQTLPTTARLPACDISLSDGTSVSFNMADWQIGDVVLTGPDLSSVGTDQITSYQKLLNGDPNLHRWWHVALYDGAGNLVEANQNVNVRNISVASWAASQVVTHRLRLATASIDQIAFQNAVAALSGQTYHASAQIMALLASRAARSELSLPAMKKPYNGDELICSVFVERVLRNTVNKELFPRKEIVVPLDYAASSDFISQPTFWCRAV